MASTMAQNLTRGDLIVPDDDMEISSDAGRGADDTVDIDIDFEVPQPQPGDDDYMIEDNPSAAKPDPTLSSFLPSDSMMFDEDGNEQIQDDGMMEDDPEAHDEELLDASDSEDADAEVTEITVYDQPQAGDDAILQPLKPDTAVNDVVDVGEQRTEILQDDASHIMEKQSLEVNQNENEISYALPNEELDQLIAKDQAAGESGLSVENNSIISPADEGVSGDVQHTQDKSTEPTEEDKLAASAPNDASEQTQNLEDLGETEIAPDDHYPRESHSSTEAIEAPVDHVETKTERATDQEEPLTTHDTDSNGQDSSYKSHPVVVLYEGSEVHLFPPAESDATATYFLNDETLVDVPLKDLLGEFRTVLGDSVTDDEELELEIGILGLSITENSSEATLSTLASVLDVYCRLCQLDQILDSNGSPHSLHVVLRTKARFSARISQMYDLIGEGKGLSHVHFINSFVEDTQDDVNEGEEGQPQLPTDQQKLSDPADVTAQSIDQGDEVSYELDGSEESEEEPEETNIGVARESDRVQNAQEISHDEAGPSAKEPSSEKIETAAQEDQHDDLIDYTEGEDEDHETSATSTTLQGDDQAAAPEETRVDSNHDSTTETAETHLEENVETTVEVSSYQQEDFDESLEQGTDLHEEFADEDHYEDQDTANDDLGFDMVGSDTGNGPELEGRLDENEHLVRGTEVFPNVDERWEGKDDEFLDFHPAGTDALEEEELDESEFLHDDEEDHEQQEDGITVADPTSDKTAPLPRSSSRKRSFAEQNEQGDGAETGNELKRSKPA